MKAGRIRAIFACFACGALSGWLVVPPPPERVAAAPVVLRLGGLDLPAGDPRVVLEAAKARIREHLASPVALWFPQAEQPIAVRSREGLGARLDPVRLEALVEQATDARSILRQKHDVIARGRPLELPMPIAVDSNRALSVLLQLKDDLDRPPEDARFDFEKGKLAPDQAGLRLDVYATLARFDEMFGRGAERVELAATRIVAKRNAAMLGEVRAAEVLGWFETRYTPGTKHAARTYNLRIAASKLDGWVLRPGELFDFNEVVGPRDEVHGFKVAPVIASGELVDGIGGGTCQIAGTLHGAAFFSGLDIVERHPHTRPSFYIKMGLDAAVAFPTVTLKFRNPFPFPVVLRETVRDGLVRAEVLGPKRELGVTFVRKIDEVMPFSERDVPDDAMPEGRRVLAQRGIPGFKISRYRIVRRGSFALRERSQDTYPPTAQIWRVGRGPSHLRWAGQDDEHPEYLADDYLMMSQGPDVEARHPVQEEGAAMIESRVPGRHGVRGWTRRAGFSRVAER